MAASRHFGCPKITFDHSSCHFRSIRNFFFFLNILTKWLPAAILDWTTMSVIELVRDIWMNNTCVKFEERSLNPSKVIALTTKLWRGGGRRWWRGGGCVADENIIFPKTYVSREYNYIKLGGVCLFIDLSPEAFSKFQFDHRLTDTCIWVIQWVLVDMFEVNEEYWHRLPTPYKSNQIKSNFFVARPH